MTTSSRFRQTEQQTVDEWLLAIRLATDEDSPFLGMVDLREIFDLPLHIQQQVYDALSDQERTRLTDLYGQDK